MRRSLFVFTALLTVGVLSAPGSVGSEWRWFAHSPCACFGGLMWVAPTYNCSQLWDPVYFFRMARYERELQEEIPDFWSLQEVNGMEFFWQCGGDQYPRRCYCADVHTSIAVPEWDDEQRVWVLAGLNSWIDEHVTVRRLPKLHCGWTGVYIMFDLTRWHKHEFVLWKQYTFVDGVCDKLPGVVVGTSAIQFDPNTPRNRNPFFTTEPFNGTLFPHGEIDLLGRNAADEDEDADEDSDLLMRALPQAPMSPDNSSCCPRSRE